MANELYKMNKKIFIGKSGVAGGNRDIISYKCDGVLQTLNLLILVTHEFLMLLKK